MKDVFVPKLDGNTVVLSQREAAVIMLVAEGMTAYKISQKLGISPRTVESTKIRIVEKTEAKNLLEVIIALSQKGIIKTNP